MKKIFFLLSAIILTIVLCLTFFACKSSDAGSDEKDIFTVFQRQLQKNEDITMVSADKKAGALTVNVSNKKDSIDFSDVSLKSETDATFRVFADSECTAEYTDAVELAIGSNLFFIQIATEDETRLLSVIINRPSAADPEKESVDDTVSVADYFGDGCFIDYIDRILPLDVSASASALGSTEEFFSLKKKGNRIIYSRSSRIPVGNAAYESETETVTILDLTFDGNGKIASMEKYLKESAISAYKKSTIKADSFLYEMQECFRFLFDYKSDTAGKSYLLNESEFLLAGNNRATSVFTDPQTQETFTIDKEFGLFLQKSGASGVIRSLNTFADGENLSIDEIALPTEFTEIREETQTEEKSNLITREHPNIPNLADLLNLAENGLHVAITEEINADQPTSYEMTVKKNVWHFVTDKEFYIDVKDYTNYSVYEKKSDQWIRREIAYDGKTKSEILSEFVEPFVGAVSKASETVKIDNLTFKKTSETFLGKTVDVYEGKKGNLTIVTKIDVETDVTLYYSSVEKEGTSDESRRTTTVTSFETGDRVQAVDLPTEIHE